MSGRVALQEWFAMDESGKRGAFIAKYTGHCHDAAAVLRGEETPPPPLEFHHHMGGRMYDWIATSHLWLTLVSARFQEVLRDGRFSGWHVIPAVIQHNRLGTIENYGCLVVTGRTGPVCLDKGRLEWRPAPVPQGRPSMACVGLHVDFGDWDGSDICTTGGGGFVIARAAVRDALVKAKVTGVEFTRLDQYEATDSEATAKLWKEMGYKD